MNTRELYRTKMLKVVDFSTTQEIVVLTRAKSVDEANELAHIIIAIHEKSETFCNMEEIAALN